MRRRALMALASLFWGCAGGGPELGQTAQALDVQNGRNLNGRNLNGRNLNGRNLNGVNFSGVSFSNITLSDGDTVTGAYLNGSSLAGSVARGVHRFPVAGNDFIGATMTGLFDDGSTVPLRIDAVTVSSSQPDVNFYAVSYEESTNVWSSLCVDANGAPLNAIPVAPTWDYSQGTETGGSSSTVPGQFTLGCTDGAIGKCVLWGYRPWAQDLDTSLTPYHQSCTRLVRADFCGDGTSYTQNGTLINVYDALGIQQDTEDWPVEAEWETTGSRCVNPNNRALDPSLLVIPCIAARLDSTCGDPADFLSGTLQMTERPLPL